MALQLPTPAQALLQTPLNTYSPTSNPLTNTTNGFTYVYNTTLGVWEASAGGGSTVTAATLAEAAAGTINTKYSSPQTAVPKNAAGMTGAALIPGGTSGQQPGSPVTGMLRYNSTTLPAFMEFWDSAAWTPVGAPPVAGLGIRISVTGSIVKVNIPQQTNPPATGTAAAQAEDGSLYWDDTLGALFVRYANGGSSTWVQTTPSASGGGAGSVRAWVNFNAPAGSVTVRASGNVSSVSFVANGQYDVNFATPLADANYAVSCCINDDPGSANGRILSSGGVFGAPALMTTNAVRVAVGTSGTSVFTVTIVR